MRSTLAALIFDLMARFPLGMLHRLGAMLGWVTYTVSGKYASRMRENLGYAMADRTEQDRRGILKASIAEAGKGVAELPWLWRRPPAEVAASIKACHGWEHVEAARAQGRGVIFLTPHLGCFEASATYAAQRIPITALYRPPKLAWLEPLMRGGREHGQISLARTDLSGVRLLFKALRRGEAIGLLPDQVPGKGEGEWAEFFGRPAYTMTLVGRLVESTGAAIIMAYAERLPRGTGYVIHLSPLEIAQGQAATAQINAALENLVLACPTQYLWSYNRYKTPATVEQATNPPPFATAGKP